MAKPSPILEKRMQELESDVNDVLSLPPHTPPHQIELFYKDFDQRIAFLRNLLSAEITSSPQKPPLHLERIQRRLLEIESACTSEPALTCLHAESDGADQEFVVNQEKVEGQGQVVETERVEKREEEGVVGGRFCWGLGVGMVVGMVVMGFAMVSFFGCLSCIHHPVCLAPT